METGMNLLSKRENQVAGLAACGKARKEMADVLKVTLGTINIHLDRAYKKTDTSKLNELGRWWIDKVFSLNVDWKEVERRIIASSMIVLIVLQLFNWDSSNYRVRRSGRRCKEEISCNSNGMDDYEMD